MVVGPIGRKTLGSLAGWREKCIEQHHQEELEALRREEESAESEETRGSLKRREEDLPDDQTTADGSDCEDAHERSCLPSPSKRLRPEALLDSPPSRDLEDVRLEEGEEEDEEVHEGDAEEEDILQNHYGEGLVPLPINFAPSQSTAALAALLQHIQEEMGEVTEGEENQGEDCGLEEDAEEEDFDADQEDDAVIIHAAAYCDVDDGDDVSEEEAAATELAAFGLAASEAQELAAALLGEQREEIEVSPALDGVLCDVSSGTVGGVATSSPLGGWGTPLAPPLISGHSV